MSTQYPAPGAEDRGRRRSSAPGTSSPPPPVSGWHFRNEPLSAPDVLRRGDSTRLHFPEFPQVARCSFPGEIEGFRVSERVTTTPKTGIIGKDQQFSRWFSLPTFRKSRKVQHQRERRGNCSVHRRPFSLKVKQSA